MTKFDAKKIKEHREAMGMSQDALANRISQASGKRVYTQQISSWESGKKNLSLTSLAKLCEALEQEPNNFFTNE